MAEQPLQTQPIETQRMAAGVEYDGTPFFGWQRQRQSPTVQACLEHALSKVANHPVEVHGSGRTDTGVHARCQVVHFDVQAKREARGWLLGTQTHLHPGIALLWVQPVCSSFHARYDAIEREYCYRILNRTTPSALDRHRVCWVHQPLDAEAMHKAGQALIGEHDFSSFRAAGCQAKHARRHVSALRVERTGDEINIHIKANAFLYHMVRNITGTLLMVGRGERPIEWVSEVLAECDRTQSGMTAPAHGLYFIKAVYPKDLDLPMDITENNHAL